MYRINTSFLVFLLLFWSRGGALADCENAIPVRTFSIPLAVAGFGAVQGLPALPLKHGEWILTIDDGPSAGTTPGLLKALEKACIKATFFLIGNRAQARPDLVRQIALEGHSIGSHSWSHLDFSKLSLDQRIEEMRRGRDSVEEALGRSGPAARGLRLFRFPGASDSGPHVSSEMMAVARGLELIVAGYDISGEDWRAWPAEESLKRLRWRLSDRGIIVLHDAQPNTVKLLPLLIDELRRKNATIVALDLR